MWVLRVLKIFPNMLDQRHCLHTKQKSWSCTDLQLHFPFHSFSHLSWGEFFLSLCVMSWNTSMNVCCARSLSMFARQNLKTWAVCYYCYLQLILWIQLSLRIISMQRLQERFETKAKTRWQKKNSFASIFFKVDLLGDVFFLAAHIRPIIDAKQRPWGIFFLCSSLHGLMGVIAWKIVLKLNFSHIPCIWELNALKWTFWMVVCLQELTGILFCIFVEEKQLC